MRPSPYTHDEICDHVLEALIRHRAEQQATLTALEKDIRQLDNMIDRTQAWLTGDCPLCGQNLAGWDYPAHHDDDGVECDFRWLAR